MQFDVAQGLRRVGSSARFHYRSREMRTTRSLSVRTIAVELLLLATVSLGLCGRAFSAEAVGTGTVAARISGLEITATLSGELHWKGEAVLGGRSTRFSASGTFSGVGVRGITTLITEGWVACSLSGRTNDGEAIEIRGLLYVRRKSIVALAADEPIIGFLYTVLLVGDSAHAFAGEFAGTAQGQLEPADTTMTIQLGGTAIVHLAADVKAAVGELPASISIAHPALGSRMLQLIDELLNLGVGEVATELPDP